jgi:hypothetical protein
MTFVLALVSVCLAQDEKKYFEMRKYTIHEGKMDDLISRFENHTLKLFEKHGIENIAYFLPTEDEPKFLLFILAYPDKESRNSLWNSFANDPEWKKVHQASEANGPLVANVDQTFMTLSGELSPKIVKDLSKGEKIFELRKYYMFEGRVENIHARFRDHTRELFQNHGMTNVMYWYTEEPNGEQSKLVYLLAHQSEHAAKESFSQFGKDPKWVKVRDDSEKDGKIVEKIDSFYLRSLPFSPLK